MPSKESGIGDNDQNGSIFAISGPVITAENMIGVAMYELVSTCQPAREDECPRSKADTEVVQSRP